MIEHFVRLGLRRPVLGALLVLATAAFGFVSLRALPSDVFPDLSTPVFNLIVQDASMAPEELEHAIAVPLETALSGVPGVRRVRSLCTLGIAQITVEFEPDADYGRARQLVAERVAQVSGSLPPGIEPPLISSVAVRINEVMELSLEAEPGKADLLALRDLAQFEVGNRLAAIPGVATVERLGGHLKEFQILLDPARMGARGVTLDDVLHAASESNLNASGGFIQRGENEWTVRALGRIASVDELRRSLVTSKGGTPVLLGDVADVREGGALRRGIAHKLVGEVVSLRIIKQFGADTVALSRAVRPVVAQIQAGLPEGVRLVIDYDQGDVVAGSLKGLGKSIAIGAVLVVFVLGLLLGDLRAAGLVTLTIPLSIAISGVVLRLTGSGFNAMTLGGLAIAVGLLVDAGIILCENVVHRLTEHRQHAADRAAIVGAACLEMARPIGFATAIVIAVFGPLVALSGIEGKLYRPLALAVVGAVGSSLFVSMQFLPGLASLLLRPRPSSKPEDVALIRGIKRIYRPALESTLRHARWVRIGTLASIVGAVLLASRIGGDFLPKLDEGALMVNTAVGPDASLDLVDRLNHRVEDALRSFPEVAEVVRRTGRGERTEDPMAHTYSDVLVVLRDDARRRGDDLVEAMRPALAKIPGIRSTFTTPLGMRIDEGLAGTTADLSVKIFGSDLGELERLAASAQRILGSVSGLADVRAESLGGVPELRLTIDREACNRLGVEVGEIARAVSTLLVGRRVSEAWVGARRYDVVVRLADEAKRDLPALRAIRIDTAHGTTVPLNEIARIEETEGPSAIRREAGMRRIAVDTAVEGLDLASAAADVRALLDEKLDLPAGTSFVLGGRVEGQERAQRALVAAILAAAAAVFLLLYLALDSLAETVVILATLPSAFVGGILALWLTDGTWNVSSLVGLIGLFGIAVQNGLVLITQTKGLIARGIPFEQAIREASVSRVRPKILTAATAILGLLPLVVFHFRGAELEKPLAVVMIGGVLTSTLFVLLALPVFYRWIHALMRGSGRPA
ncbi:MAG TPA: efflux RND transporter permease subunit [Planctomycetota bacterium]|jgi:cobalt-zinc-cadmium resistance protein CzcA|nr:efflux RND transporter permease subunit [Planctomycetota bacterium]